MAHEEMAQDDPLQAVVLCDVFTQRFAPLTLDMPRCLMPVCNVPLIEWTLEALAKAGVHEVFFLATWHAPQIRAYLEEHHPALVKPSRGTSVNTSSLTKVSLIAVPEARSVGDAMRELDAHQIITTDFILMHADAVGNMDLAAVVEAHKQRRRADRNAIMTICTMPVGHRSRARPLGDLSVFALAPSTSQLLHYTAVPAIPRKPMLKLPLELFDDESAMGLSGKGAEMDVRNDLVDCGVDVCSIDVPPLFTENFDYQSLRREFVQGILTSDLLEAKIFVHVAPPANASSTSSGIPWDASSNGLHGSPAYGEGYMLRASGPAAYDVVCNDVMTGWTYPYTPRLGLPDGTVYTRLSSLRFLGAGATCAMSGRIGLRSVLGAETRLEDDAEVSHVMIGARVTIGARSKVHHAYIWDDVRIGTGCDIAGCMIGHNVTILDNVRIPKGSVIAQGVTIGPEVDLPRGARVSLHPYRASEDEEEEEEEEERGDAAALGAQGQGFLWEPLGAKRSSDDDGDDDDDDEHDDIESPLNAKLFAMGADLDDVALSDAASELSSIDADSDPEPLLDDSDLDDSDSDSDLSSPHSASVYGSVSLTLPGGTESQTYGEKLESEQRLNEFRAEATASLERAFEERHAPENAAIELKTLRMASNVPPGEVRKVAISFVLARCSVDQAKDTADLLDHWGPLLQEVAHDDQVEALATMQSFCAANVTHTKLFLPLLKKVYNDEIVADESILAWWRHASSRRIVLDVDDSRVTSVNQIVLELRKRAEPVVRHILESQESSDEDEEEDNDDDDE